VDALLRAQRAWDASAAVHPDEALDAARPALRDEQYAEKLAAREPAVQAQGGRRCRPLMLPPLEQALCIRDGGRFAA
jgi:hypothetical protein